MSLEFQHSQSAHCESGATSNLLRHAGFPVSEAMAFGIGSGLFFFHCPWVKVMELPLTSYRSFPGTIFKKTCRRLGIPYEYRRFRDPLQGRRALDRFLSEGQAVGARTNIYWLPYIPERFRFQFNGHNIVIYGKSGEDEYQVSDPIMDVPTICPTQAMNRSRFASGPLAPHGLLFFPTPKPGARLESVLEGAIRAGLRETVRRMLYTPLPFVGIRGIRYLSRRMAKWPDKIRDTEKLTLNLANIVRMQEEIGTGGAGFRYLYAAFLQEASEHCRNPALSEAARRLTDVGNIWREFATLVVQQCKGRATEPYEKIPAALLKIADLEEGILRDLGRRYL